MKKTYLLRSLLKDSANHPTCSTCPMFGSADTDDGPSRSGDDPADGYCMFDAPKKGVTETQYENAGGFDIFDDIFPDVYSNASVCGRHPEILAEYEAACNEARMKQLPEMIDAAASAVTGGMSLTTLMNKITSVMNGTADEATMEELSDILGPNTQFKTKKPD